MTRDWMPLTARCEMSSAEWSVLVVDWSSSEALFAFRPERTLRTASVAKVLLLVECARQIEAGELDSAEALRRDPRVRVSDSGVWQHLHTDRLPVDDVARLVGLASDNWATNVLLQRVGGVGQVAATAEAAGLRGVALHDRVRDERTQAHPPTLSTGSATGYVELLAKLAAGAVLSDTVSARVLAWLKGGLDLSMVASAFGLDPLAHDAHDRGFAVVNKTGTDDGVRVDVGIACGPNRTLLYACLANWTLTDAADSERDAVLKLMHDIGQAIRGLL